MITVRWEHSDKSDIERARKVFSDKRRQGVTLYTPAKKKMDEFDEKLMYFCYTVSTNADEDDA